MPATLKLPDFLHLVDSASDSVELAAGGENGEKLPSYSMVAYTGVAVNLGWGFPTVIDLAGMRVDSQSIPNLFYHDQQRVVGHTKSVEVTSRQIKASGILSAPVDDPDAKKITSMSKNGFKWQASIGAHPSKVVLLERGQSENVNGRRVDGPAYIVRQSVLREISFVPLGADGATSATVAAAAKSVTGQLEAITVNFETWLAAKGIDNYVTMSEAGKTFVKDLFEQDQVKAAAPANPTLPAGPVAAAASLAGNPPTSPADPIVARRNAEAADLERIDKIHSICAEYKNPKITVGGNTVLLSAHAIREGWGEDKVKLEALQMSRPVGPAIHSHGRVQATHDVVLAACSMEVGLQLQTLEKNHTPEILDQAHKLKSGGIGLQWLIKQSAYANGYTDHIERITAGNIKSVLLAAFPVGGVQAGFSTISLPGMFGDLTNRALTDAFNYVDQSWRRIAAIASVKDFRKINTYRMTGDMTYEPLAPSGELKNGKVGEAAYENQAKTHGKIFSITREHIVNDDIGVVKAIAERLGRGSATGMNKVFWKEFLDNADFFKTANANYFADASGSSLDLTGLKKAYQLFGDLKNEEGEPMGSTPRILLVPQLLTHEARTLMASADFHEYGTGTKVQVPTKNIYAGMFDVVASAYLQNAAYPGYSNKAWYLLCDPLDLAAIQAVFLDGRQTPIVETAQADFNELGIHMRGYHDIGCKKQEYRAGVKMKGEA